ncbi:MAG: nuclear transport factor 2 family protein [Novosphingobium sp.]|nr:nuclear transport factor 2 family protein [Novosphingobium sp.]
MAYTLQQLSDIEDIKLLKHRYFRGMDTAEWALVDTLFTDDVTVDYRGGGYRVQSSGKADLMLFLKNSFHSDAVAMHHGNMPEITLTGDDEAEGIWYLYDIFVDKARGSQTVGSAIYRDRYRREGGQWKIAHSEYGRIIELVSTLPADTHVTVQWLATRGLKPEERQDITHLISFGDGHG